MPIASSLDPKNYDASVETIVQEFLRDFFPAADYVVTFEQPGPPTKPTLWLQRLPSRNRAIRERTGGAGSRTVQGKEVVFAVSALSRDRAVAVQMADRLEAAVLASSSVLGAAQLRYVQMSPMYDVPTDTQPASFVRTGTLRFTAQI